jgi:hypothetical protein
MSGLSLATALPATLADLLGETLDDALAAGSATCLWCGAAAVAAVADRWSGRVVLRCPECGSALEGAGRRRAREARP